MNRSTASLLLCSASLALGLLPGAHAQTSARFSGRVLNAAGQPQTSAVVRLVSDPTAAPAVHPMRYTIAGDSLGKFSQEGVAPGAYLVMVFTGGKGTDVLKRVQLRPGEVADLTLFTGSKRPEVAAVEPLTGVRSRTSAPIR